MEVILDKRADDISTVKSLHARFVAADSLEEIILLCMQNHLPATLCMEPKEERSRDIFAVLGSEGPDEPKKKPSCFGRIAESEWRSWGSFKPVNTTVQKLADKDELIPDLEWLEARNKRLGVREDSWEGEVVAPPGAMRELVMSYLLSEQGMVVVKREIVEIESGVKEAARLRLIGFPEEQGTIFQEWIAVRLDWLERLVNKRKIRNAQQVSEHEATV